MVLLFIIVVAIIIIAAKSRAKQERVVKHTLEETIQITRNHLIKDLVFLGIGIIVLILGIVRYNKGGQGFWGNAFQEFAGVIEAAAGGIVALVYLIATFSNLSRIDEYKEMSQNQYKQHQENTSQQIKKEDEESLKAAQTAQRWIFWQNIKRLNGW